MKYFLLFLFVCSCYHARSQKLFADFFLGAANYNGDLGGPQIPPIHSHPAFGLGLYYEINNRMGLKADLNYGKISGSDKYGGTNKDRNLSFTSTITEFAFTFQYILFDLYDYKVSPYFFIGVSKFAFNPYTKDTKGNIVYLTELNTEGQGFYQDRKEYKTKQTAIPFGGGLMWAINDNKRISLFMGIRKTSTDYLDDVSTTYIDYNILSSKRGTTATGIAYRGDELTNGAPYPADGTQRGNAKNKDWYYFTGASLSLRLVPPHSYRKQNDKARRAKITCPKL